MYPVNGVVENQNGSIAIHGRVMVVIDMYGQIRRCFVVLHVSIRFMRAGDSKYGT